MGKRSKIHRFLAVNEMLTRLQEPALPHFFEARMSTTVVSGKFIPAVTATYPDHDPGHNGTRYRTKSMFPSSFSCFLGRHVCELRGQPSL